MQDEYAMFKVGVNVIVLNDNHLLLGKRKNIYGDGTWGLPGGHLEADESMVDAAARELMEETALRARRFVFSNLVYDRSSNAQYIQVGFIAEGVEGEVALKEPDRCSEWRWFPLTDLPEGLFEPHRAQIKNTIDKCLFADA